MRSLFHDEKRSQSPIGSSSALSIALHALVLAVIVAASVRVRHAVILRPMTQGSAQRIAIVAVGRGALASVLAAQSPALPEKTHEARSLVPRHLTPARAKAVSPQPSAQPAPQAAAQPAPAPQGHGVNGGGSDSQSMYPAYPIVSPSPQVRDRSLLPATDQRVIVDVSLGADGQVKEAQLTSGLGNALDQLVLDTVRTWQFHPATLNGQPVPSTIELVFPFNRNYPEPE